MVLNQRHSELYQELKQFYQQDTLARLLTDEKSNS